MAAWLEQCSGSEAPAEGIRLPFVQEPCHFVPEHPSHLSFSRERQRALAGFRDKNHLIYIGSEWIVLCCDAVGDY